QRCRSRKAPAERLTPVFLPLPASGERQRRTPTWTADGLLLRTVPDRTCQRGVAVPGRFGPVDHLWRDADRQFRPWRVLYARRLCRLHADRIFFRRARL